MIESFVSDAALWNDPSNTADDSLHGILSDILVRDRNTSPELRYLVGMCFEQAGFMSAIGPATQGMLPFDDDE